MRTSHNLTHSVRSLQVVGSYYIDRMWRIVPSYYLLLFLHLSMVMYLLLKQPKAISKEAEQVALYMTDGDIRCDMQHLGEESRCCCWTCSSLHLSYVAPVKQVFYVICGTCQASVLCYQHLQLISQYLSGHDSASSCSFLTIISLQSCDSVVACTVAPMAACKDCSCNTFNELIDARDLPRT